jgi:hypothetical protein
VKIEAPVAICTPVRKETESADYVPFNNSPRSASVNVLAAAVRTIPHAELFCTHRRRNRSGRRSSQKTMASGWVARNSSA